MAFFNWNLVTTPVPTYYTYIIQPSFAPVTTLGVANQALPTLQLNNGVKFVQQTVNSGTQLPTLQVQGGLNPQLPTLQLNSGLGTIQGAVNSTTQLPTLQLTGGLGTLQGAVSNNTQLPTLQLNNGVNILQQNVSNTSPMPTLQLQGSGQAPLQVNNNGVGVSQEQNDEIDPEMPKLEPYDGIQREERVTRNVNSEVTHVKVETHDEESILKETMKKEEELEQKDASVINFHHVSVKEEGIIGENSFVEIPVKEEREDEETHGSDFFPVPIKQEKEEEEEDVDMKSGESSEDDSYKTESEAESLSDSDEIITRERHKKIRRQSKRNKSFQCDHCSYTTTWKGNLTKHIVSRHTALEEINWLQCSHCSYKGKTKDYLKCHLLHVHNISVKWFNCSHCPFKAKIKSHLERHMIIKHTETEKINWFQCDKCSYKAKFKINLKQHILSKHTDSNSIKWFQCEYCKFRAKRKRNLKFHQLNKHTELEKFPWLECELCPCRFKGRAQLKLHLSAVHQNQGIKLQTREIPVFIDSKIYWKTVVVPNGGDSFSFKCAQCNKFETLDKEVFKKHVMKEHVVTELKKVNNHIVRRSYKTKDVVVMVGDVPCVRKVVEHPLSQNLVRL